MENKIDPDHPFWVPQSVSLDKSAVSSKSANRRLSQFHKIFFVATEYMLADQDFPEAVC